MRRGRNRGSEAGVVFDFDGTLVDSAPAMTRAINEMARRRGTPPVDVAAMRRFVSLGGTAMLNAALGEQTDPVADLDELRTLLREQDTNPNDLYPGVVDTLAGLKQDGYRIGVCTNKSEDIAVPYAAGLGIAGHLDVIIGGAAGRRLKPDPQLAYMALEQLGVQAGDAVFVGDSEIDAQTAAAARLPFVLVTFGYPHGAIDDIPASSRINDLRDLPTIVPGLIAAGC